MAPGSPATLLSLPDDVLEKVCCLVLAPEVQPGRYAPPPRHVALACRRLRAAANSPMVLHTLTASVGSPESFASDGVLRPLRSLCHFVVRVAAPHVQRLKLGLWPAEEMEPADWLEAGMLLASLLQACSGLEVLEIAAKTGFVLTLSDWVGGLTSLRRLNISSRNALQITADLRRMSRLTDLAVFSGNALAVEPVCRLPPSLTSLSLQSPTSLPSQLAALTGLQSLYLISAAASPADYDALERLTSLRRLTLKRCRLPGCLGRLTSLRLLRLLYGTLAQDDWHVCSQALPRLANLRHLDLHSQPAPVSESLARCSLHVLRICPAKFSGAALAKLPSGHWLAELRELAAPARVLRASTRQLRAATQLQHVAVLHADAAGSYLPPIVNWAAGHAPLRLLAVDGTKALSPATWVNLLEAQRSRPDLQIMPCDDALEAVAARRNELDLPE